MNGMMKKTNSMKVIMKKILPVLFLILITAVIVVCGQTSQKRFIDVSIEELKTQSFLSEDAHTVDGSLELSYVKIDKIRDVDKELALNDYRIYTFKPNNFCRCYGNRKGRRVLLHSLFVDS